MKKGINPLKDKVPVVPAQHYTMGGIKVDINSKNFNEKFVCYWRSCLYRCSWAK